MCNVLQSNGVPNAKWIAEEAISLLEVNFLISSKSRNRLNYALKCLKKELIDKHVRFLADRKISTTEFEIFCMHHIFFLRPVDDFELNMIDKNLVKILKGPSLLDAEAKVELLRMDAEEAEKYFKVHFSADQKDFYAFPADFLSREILIDKYVCGKLKDYDHQLSMSLLSLSGMWSSIGTAYRHFLFSLYCRLFD